MKCFAYYANDASISKLMLMISITVDASFIAYFIVL